jgi:hypothetical protein
LELQFEFTDSGAGAQDMQAVATDLRWRLEAMDGMGNLSVRPGDATAISVTVGDWPALAAIMNLVRWRTSEAGRVTIRLLADGDELQLEGGSPPRGPAEQAWIGRQRARLPAG